MVKFFDRIGEKLPNKLAIYIVSFSIALYAMDLIMILSGGTPLSAYLTFYRTPIAMGQIWRIFTFVIVDEMVVLRPMSILLSMFNFYVNYSFINTANQLIGYKKVNSFLVANYVFLTIYGLIFGAVGFDYVFLALILGVLFLISRSGYNVSPINMAFAVMILVLSMINALNAPYILVSLVLGFIYFVPSLPNIRNRTTTGTNQTQKKNVFNESKKEIARHKCAVCGKTDLTHPDMTFRFCSKCEGNYEYCEEHLKDHEHKTKVVQFPQKNKQ